MKRAILFYSLAAVLLYCMFLIITLPAGLAWQWLSAKLTEVRVHNVEGTVWHGRAEQLTMRGVPFDNVEWRIFPLQLLLGKVSMQWQFRSSDGKGQGMVQIGFSGDIGFSKTHVENKITTLSSVLPAMPVVLAGDIKLDLVSAIVHDGTLTELTGSADWSGGRTVSPVVYDIGSFHAECSTRQQEIQARVTDTAGPLALQGVLRLQPQGGYDFVAEVKPRAEAQPPLLDALQQFARPVANGGFRLEYRGRL